MREGWRHARLGEVAALDIESVRVVPGRRYAVAGVLNAGQGLFKRESIDGSQTNYPTLHRLRAGQLVMRKLTAWEGPITCVPAEYEGFFVSAEFPTFTLSPDLLPSYMALVCQRPEFWELLKDRSTGSVQRRKRVSPSELLAISLDMPPVSEQGRITDLVGGMDELADASNRLLSASMDLYASLLDSQVRDPAVPGERRDIAALTTLVRRGRAPAYADVGVLVLGQRCVRDGHIETGYGRRTDPATSPVPEWAYLRPGDTVINSTGVGALGRVAFCRSVDEPTTVDGHVTVVRPDSAKVLPAYLYLALRAREQDLIALQSGSTKQTELSPDKVSSLVIGVPPRAEQERAVELIEAVDGAARAARAHTRAVRTACTALLAQLLSGEHEIPTSYDRFLDGAA